MTLFTQARGSGRAHHCRHLALTGAAGRRHQVEDTSVFQVQQVDQGDWALRGPQLENSRRHLLSHGDDIVRKGDQVHGQQQPVRGPHCAHHHQDADPAD